MGLLFSVSAVFAEQKMMVNEDGEVWLIDHTHQWEVASEAEMRAYQHPGVEVPVELRAGKVKKVDFFHCIHILKYSEVIVWDGKKFQTIKKVGEEYGGLRLAWHLVFLLITIIFMAISNIATKADRISLIAAASALGAFTTALAVFTAFITFAFANTTLTAFVTLAAAAALIAYIAEAFNNKRKYKIFSTIFYILSFIAIIVWMTI